MLFMTVAALAVASLLSSVALAQPFVVLDCEAGTAVGLGGAFDCAAAQGGSSATSIIAAPQTLNPITSQDTASGQIIDYALGSGFFTSYSLLGAGASGTVPQLASVVEVSEDGTAATYILREGLTYSDGSALTTDDLLYWYDDVIYNPNLPNSFTDAFVCIDGSPFALSVDGLAVTVSCSEPFRTFVGNAADIPVMSKQMALDYIADQDIPTEDGTNGPRALQEFMGLGIDISKLRSLSPYVMTQFVSDQVAVYERNPNSYMVDSNGMQLPYLDQLSFNIFPTNGQNLSLSAFLNGQTDFIGPRSADIAPILGQAAGGGFSVNGDIDNGTPATGTQWVTTNFDDEDPNLAAINRNATARRAMSLATDRVAMVNNVLLGIGTPTFVNATLSGAAAAPYYIGRNNTCDDFIASGLATADSCADGLWTTGEGLVAQVTALPPPDADFQDHLSCLNDYAACVASAQALLAGIGVTDTDGDGILNIPADLDGSGNAGGNWNVQVTTNVGNTNRENFIQIICDSWSQLGINCTVNPVAFSTLVTQLLGIEGATWTGAIMLGLTGGDPAGGSNVYRCGAALYFWHLSCDPSATSGSTAQLADGGASVQASFDVGFASTSVAGAQGGFDDMQRAWINSEPYLQLAVGNGLFAARVDRTCNDGRAVVANFELKYRTDVAGNEGTCSSNVGR
jgi:ABC-type transport system substrate-binding protein